MNAQTWDERLITPERAWQIAEHWPLSRAVREDQAYLDCDKCGQAVTRFYPAITPGFIVSAVIRHAVTHHDQSLSGGAQHGGSSSTGSAGQEAGRPDPARHGGGGGHPGDRPEHQEADPGGSDQPQGGDQR